MTKAQYLTRVNAICSRFNGLQRALPQPAGSLQEQAAIAHRSNMLTLEAIASIRRVSPPAGDEERIHFMLDETARAARTADSSTRLIFDDTARANDAMERAQSLLRDANARYAAYGLTVCAS